MPLLEFDLDLIQRYDVNGPRYTSYPTAVQFTTDFSLEDYKNQIAQGNELNKPLSLYFHLPFCDTICYYCACNKIVTKNRKRAQPYLDNLHTEIQLQAELFDTDRKVEQLHWGGGTPTFISHQQMRDLMQSTRDHFNLYDDDQGEYSIEIDPREADADTILLLRELGFNRLSLGVQDINDAVQKAVNRIQTIEQTSVVIDAARSCGFQSISLDLIYGLPLQTHRGFIDTVDKIIELNPDRISVFNYAHLPEMFKTQRQIKSEQLPSTTTKLAILEHTITRLTEAGYLYIGMDHFAKPNDELSLAQASGHLYRNFQGYSTHADCDLVGLGVTSIGKIHNSYSQNYRTIEEYTESLNNNTLPIFRGITLDQDDIIRQKVITELICNFKLDTNKIENEYAISFSNYFSQELKKLDKFIEDELVSFNNNIIHVTAKGTLFIRNICMLFDKYIKKSKHRYSKAL